MSDVKIRQDDETFYLFTNQEERAKRQEICNTCTSKKGVFCGECGCFLIFLRKIETASCPLKKW